MQAHYNGGFQETGGKFACRRRWLFCKGSARLCRMDKAEHGRRLRTAMAERGLERKDVSAAVAVAERTITNWTSGKTMPSERERVALRRLFPGYDDPGDRVEVAIMNSQLTEDRQYALVGTYKRLLREQAEGTRATG